MLILFVNSHQNRLRMNISATSFNNIPQEIASNILSKVYDFEALKNCETVSKLFNGTVNKFENYQTKKEEFFGKKFFPEIVKYPLPTGLVDALGGYKKILELPVCELGIRDQGGYPDWLKPKDLPGKICRGVIQDGRPFISFAFSQYQLFPLILGNGVKTIHPLRSAGEAADIWYSCGHHGRDFQLYLRKNETGEEIFSRLKNLFSNGYEGTGSKLTVLGENYLLPYGT